MHKRLPAAGPFFAGKPGAKRGPDKLSEELKRRLIVALESGAFVVKAGTVLRFGQAAGLIVSMRLLEPDQSHPLEIELSLTGGLSLQTSRDRVEIGIDA